MRVSRRFALPAAAVAAALAAAVLPAVPAGAGTATTELTLVLRPTSETALHDLAGAHGLSAAERHSRVEALIPSAARRADVEAAARGLGLQVESSSPWSLRVDAPYTVVTSLFGTLPPRRAAAAGRAYPQVPAALSAYVVAALPATGKVARPLATASRPHTAGDFRAAYSAPAGGTGAGLGVATVQLSGWKSAAADLRAYAKDYGYPSFDPTKQYVPRPFPGSASPTKNDDQLGDEEVALDQEAILSVAPAATQYVYFAPNDDGGDGYINAIKQVATDAHDLHTVALSLSWGGCEASDDRAWLKAMDQALEMAVAAGVTVFAASGDAGSQDCLGEVPDARQYAATVDYPASSPWVVGVGGTSSASDGSTVGWSGSGGGESAIEALPTWQYGVASKSKHNRRLVPDISSFADPEPGFCVLDSSAGESGDKGCPAGYVVLAGTSLSSPTQAALLADTLDSLGWTSGVGDIHSALYEGAAAGAVTDVIADQDAQLGNGDYKSGRGFDLVTGLGTPVWTTLQDWLGTFDIRTPRGTRSTTVAMSPRGPVGFAAGYASWSPAVVGTAPTDCAAATSTTAPKTAQLPADGADGSYTVYVAALTNATPRAPNGTCHIAAMRVALDRHLPTVSASVRVSSSGIATAQWGFSDPSPSAGLQKFVVEVIADGKTQYKFTTTDRLRTFSATRFSRWHVRVTGYDNAGNASAAVAHVFDDTTLKFTGSWSRTSTNAAFRRSYARSTSPGATATIAGLTGRTFALYVRTCNTCGQLGVYDDRGHRLKVVDTYSSSTHYRVRVVVLNLPAAAKRSFVLKVLSSKNKRSNGRSIGVDALSFA